MRKELKSAKFSVEIIKDNDDLTYFYTGLPRYLLFTGLVRYLLRKAENLTPWNGGQTVVTPSAGGRRGARPWKNISIANQFFAVVARLHLGLHSLDVATRMSMSEASYSRMFATWILLLAKELPLLFP